MPCKQFHTGAYEMVRPPHMEQHQCFSPPSITLLGMGMLQVTGSGISWGTGIIIMLNNRAEGSVPNKWWSDVEWKRCKDAVLYTYTHEHGNSIQMGVCSSYASHFSIKPCYIYQVYWLLWVYCHTPWQASYIHVHECTAHTRCIAPQVCV